MPLKSNRKSLSLLLPLAMLVVGLYLVPLNIFDSDFSKFPGDFGDGRFNNYILEHGHQFISGEVEEYWDAEFMYPHKNVIAFSDNLLGTVPVYSVFRFLGYDRESAYQCWFLALFVLNFVFCYLALFKWSGNLVLASVGAYIFAFSLIFVAQSNHVQVFPRFMIPMVFYWCWKYLTQKELKYFAFTAMGIVYQLYCGMYLGLLLIYCLFFLWMAYLLVYRDKSFFKQFKNIRHSVYHLLIILISATFLVPLFQPYLDISSELYPLTFEQIEPSIPTLRSYFFTSTSSGVWNSLSQHGITTIEHWWHHFLFPGAIPWMAILLIPVVLLSRSTDSEEKRFVRFIGVAFILSVIFCIRIHGFSLYQYVFELPGYASMRSMNRIATAQIMFFVIIVVFVFHQLSRNHRIMKWLVYGLPLLVIGDNLVTPEEVMRYDLNESRQQIDSVKQIITQQYEGKRPAIAFIQYSNCEDHTVMNLNVMLATQELHLPCVNAYTGYLPNPYIDFAVRGSKESLYKWCKANQTDSASIQIIHTGRTEERNQPVYLKSGQNGYLDVQSMIFLFATGSFDTPATPFTLITYDNDECAILSPDRHFLSAELAANNDVTSTRTTVGDWETFTLIKLDSNRVAFKAANNKFLTVNKDTRQMFVTADSIGVNEQFILEFPR